jgi:tRNA-uridine 2-sulfurtransferase
MKKQMPKPSRSRVAVAMSGGVDSSVSAALLKQAGYEVSGIHMQLWSGGVLQSKLEDNLEMVERTCRLLDIPWQLIDFEQDFKSCIIRYFHREYSAGLTPNPCIMCNEQIKFGRLLDKARELGGDFLATGHFARVEKTDTKYRLLKGVEEKKDQSYFLYRLGQAQLSHVLFPVGGCTKARVRQIAAEFSLPASQRTKSTDICFIPGDYHQYIAQNLPTAPGDIVDSSGKVLGRHTGLAQFTVGQRHGLKIGSAEPLYVVRLEAKNNRVVAGSKGELLKNSLTAGKLTWISGAAPPDFEGITAKVRYQSPDVSVKLFLNNETARVEFAQPQSAIAAGQSVVFYRGEEVLGGGIIRE